MRLTASLAMSAGHAPCAATIEAAVASVTRLTDPPRFVLGSKSASRRAKHWTSCRAVGRSTNALEVLHGLLTSAVDGARST